MNYRKFNAGGNDIDVSLLGFGAMRLPVLDGDESKIDEPEAIRMIRYAIDNGVNYVDTAYLYHGSHSEEVVGKALADGYREKVLLATKLPFWSMNGPEEITSVIDNQLRKLGTDHIDMYLVHSIKGSTWGVVQGWEIWDHLVKHREAGRIRYIGFSFHGETPGEFKEILDAYPWDFCQLQLNYMDQDIQAGMEGFQYAVSKGVPVVIMEPLKGGKLTDFLLPSIKEYWDSLDSDHTPAEWALRWVADLPGVITILSGMSTMEQLEENIRVLSDADVGLLSDHELDVIDKVAEEYNKLTAYSCTNCKYCMPCTADIDIPLMMSLRNAYGLYDSLDKIKYGDYFYNVEVPASVCTACGKCEVECPQNLEIIRAMKEIVELFE